MPAVLIEVRRHYTADEEVSIMRAVHDALVIAFQIPPEDRNVRLLVHEPHRFAVSAELAHPEYRTIITIDCFEGRSLAAKRRLYTEIDQPNWGVGGGRPASDVDLGFTVEI